MYRGKKNNFNLEKALSTKGVTDFGWNQITDIDAFHVSPEYAVVVENKFADFNDKKKNDYQIALLKDFIDSSSIPTIFVRTRNLTDIRNLPYHKKVIDLANCEIVDVYKNPAVNFPIAEAHTFAELINYLESYFGRGQPYEEETGIRQEAFNCTNEIDDYESRRWQAFCNSPDARLN